MKNILLALAIILFASTAQASTANKKFVSIDNTVASNLCVIAAKDGYKAAVDHAKISGEKDLKRMICNGKSIKRFAKSFQVKEILSKEILVVPANNSFESNICAQAVKNGLESVNSDDINQTICNGQQIVHFVKRYSNS